MKNERVLKNWQLHKLSNKMYTNIKKVYGKDTAPYILTGTVVKDKFGKISPGMHCRSSVVTRVSKKRGVVDTLTTTYKLIGKEGDTLPDMGDAVFNIYY